ncbi:MAG: hypothetical protein V3W28_08295 [Thermoplasmata archaeon]
MGKPSKFEQDTRDKLVELEEEWSELEKEKLAIQDRQKIVDGKKSVLAELFKNGKENSVADPTG